MDKTSTCGKFNTMSILKVPKFMDGNFDIELDFHIPHLFFEVKFMFLIVYSLLIVLGPDRTKWCWDCPPF